MATEAVILKTKNKEGPEAACHFLLNEGFGIAPPVQASPSARYTSAWTGPGRDAGDGPYRRKWQVLK